MTTLDEARHIHLLETTATDLAALWIIGDHAGVLDEIIGNRWGKKQVAFLAVSIFAELHHQRGESAAFDWMSAVERRAVFHMEDRETAEDD